MEAIEAESLSHQSSGSARVLPSSRWATPASLHISPGCGAKDGDGSLSGNYRVPEKQQRGAQESNSPSEFLWASPKAARLSQCCGMSPEAGVSLSSLRAYCGTVGRHQRGLVSLSFYLVFLGGLVAVGFHHPASPKTQREVSPPSRAVYYVDACVGSDRACKASSQLTYAATERRARVACANGIKSACMIGPRSTIGLGGYTISNRP